MSTRQDIVDAVTTRLKTIQKSGGYNTDLGYNVYEWRPGALEQSELPSVIVRDLGAEAMDGAIGQFRWSCMIECTITAADGTDTMQTMRWAIEDVYTAIGTDCTWGGLAQYSEQPSDSIEVDQEEHLIAGARVAFRIIYDTARWAM